VSDRFKAVLQPGQVTVIVMTAGLQ
jgi:hypothetical protein